MGIDTFLYYVLSQYYCMVKFNVMEDDELVHIIHMYLILQLDQLQI